VKYCDFTGIKSVIDIGTGGGFPGIPLAIMFPEIKFHLVDSIGKKINVVNEVAQSIELKNVLGEHQRTESSEYGYDLAVARAVAPAIKLYDWMKDNWMDKPKFYLLKGGDLLEELNELLQLNPRLKIKSNNISKVFKEDFFETKKVITIE
jgi:16S rRNA (guanine527-N7)-methyltransferase